MSTESLAEKAAALLTAGRVIVRKADRRMFAATVDGVSGRRYWVLLNAGGWSCECPAGQHRQRCSHLAACQLIVDHPTHSGRTG